MKLDKEKFKQIILIITGIVLICVGYLNYTLDFNQDENINLARKRK